MSDSMNLQELVESNQIRKAAAAAGTVIGLYTLHFATTHGSLTPTQKLILSVSGLGVALYDGILFLSMD